MPVLAGVIAWRWQFNGTCRGDAGVANESMIGRVFRA
jgi:hypothetical protein